MSPPGGLSHCLGLGSSIENDVASWHMPIISLFPTTGNPNHGRRTVAPIGNRVTAHYLPSTMVGYLPCPPQFMGCLLGRTTQLRQWSLPEVKGRQEAHPALCR